MSIGRALQILQENIFGFLNRFVCAQFMFVQFLTVLIVNVPAI